MRLIFINRFFFPDESATSLMLTDLVGGLSSLEVEMRVITAAASYADTGSASAATLPAGLSVTRLPNLPVSHGSLGGRLLNFVAFYLALIFAGLWHIRRGDLVICLTDPPLVGIFATFIAQIKGARVIHWVQDIYPETAIRLGYGSASNPALRIAIQVRDWAWRKAARNVVIGERMHDLLRSRGVASRQLRVIQNWVDEEEIVPLNPASNPVRRDWGFPDDALVVGYSGNLGRAHDASTMLEAARLLTEENAQPIKWLFIGGGAKHALLGEAKGDPQLAGRIEQRPYRPRSELPQSLNVPDIHWLSLEPELESLIVPSKFYGAAAVGKPIIFIGDPDGEVARLIDKASCGASFAKGDAEGVARFIGALGRKPELRQRLGDNARNYADKELARHKRLEEWRELISLVRAEQAFAAALAESLKR